MNAVLDNDVVDVAGVLQHPLVAHFDTLTGAPGGVMLLRELILTLAVQGKLVPQNPGDLPASALIEKSQAVLLGKASQRRTSTRETEVASSDKSLPDLPYGWSWCKGSDIYSVLRGVTYQKQDARERPMENYTPILRANNIRGTVNFDDLVYVPSNLISTEQALQPGDFVVCLASGSKNLVGKAAIYLGTIVCSFGAFCGVIRPSINLPFLSIFLSSPMYRNEVSEASSGIGINNLKSTTLLDLTIPLPPEAEQTRIVKRVHELMRLCDALEEKGRLEAEQHARLLDALLNSIADSSTPDELAANWQRVAKHFNLLLDRPTAVDSLEKTIIQLAVRGLLTQQTSQEEAAYAVLQEIRAEKLKLYAEGKIRTDKELPEIEECEKRFALPAGWEWTRLRNITTHLGDGLHGTPDYSTNGDWYFINGNNLKNGRIITKPDTKRVDEVEFEKYKKPLGDRTILVSINGTLGNVAFFKGERVVLGKSACYFNLGQGLNKEFMKLIIDDFDFKEYALRKATGSTIKNLGLKAIGEFPIALPPIAEQYRIVARVDQLLTLCARLRQRLMSQQATQTYLVDALMEQAAAY